MQKIITALKQQKNNPNRVNVFLDGQFGFAVYKIVAAYLKIDQAISENSIEKLLQDDLKEDCYQKALKFIAFKPRSRQEVINRLKRYDFNDETISSIIKVLEEKKYINDIDFAQNWVENRTTCKPRSKNLIRWELRNKKISDEIIEKISDEMPTDEELVIVAAEKYSKRLTGCEKDVFFRRLAGYLMRRGFPFSIVNPVVNKTWEDLRQQKFNNEYGKEVDEWGIKDY